MFLKMLYTIKSCSGLSKPNCLYFYFYQTSGFDIRYNLIPRKVCRHASSKVKRSLKMLYTIKSCSGL